ncbi:OmpA family protein [Halopseudomonas salegens]|uniref:Outer membrane protein OmpA n=1 Tax=Halopseudomonas salegens TaxID=1434072 RepID=A0A1H2FZE3_9GAMM|nr:OmpA family protein [Halopseudomonas salegens]SDU12744.1 Outer membrane protein OmpA [Halopseudomonas salegens]
MTKLAAIGSTLSLAFLIGCATPPPPPPEPTYSWADSREPQLSQLAAEEGFELEREGEMLRLIIPVDGNFHPKRTLLQPSGLVPLSKVAKALRHDNESQFAVIGHSDTRGDSAINRQQSLERAQAVASVLMLGGVSSQRMQLRSMGEFQPRADNSTDSGRALNRRIEILLQPYPTNVAFAN